MTPRARPSPRWPTCWLWTTGPGGWRVNLTPDGRTADGPDRLGHLHRRPALLRDAARGRALRDGEEVRHEGHRVLRRLRADDLVHLAGRDRVRHQGPAVRRLRQDRRNDLARRSGSGGRAEVVPPPPCLAADRRALRRLVHALRAG